MGEIFRDRLVVILGSIFNIFNTLVLKMLNVFKNHY